MRGSPDFSEEDREEESVPLSNVPFVKIRPRPPGKKNELEQCIEAEYRRSIIIYPNKESVKGWRRHIGIVFAFTTAILISVNLLLVKFLITKYYIPPFTISLWSSVGALPLSTVLFGYFVLTKKRAIFRDVWPHGAKNKWVVNILVTLNGIFSWASVVLVYWSLAYVDLAYSAAIVGSSPAVVVLLAHLFLKEKCTVISALVSAIALIGVGIITGSPFITGHEEFQTDILNGTALAFGCAFGYSFVTILLRKIRKVHFSVLIFTHGVITAILSAVAPIAFGGLHLPETKMEAVFAVGLILSGFAVQVSLVLALKFEEAARVALIVCLEVVLSFISQYIFLDTKAGIYSLVGTMLIICSALLAILRKQLEALPMDHPGRKWCCVFLK